MRLRAALRAGGVVATVAGLDTVVRGARSVAGRPRAGPELDSELRFYSAFYVAYGLAMLRVAGRGEPDPRAVRALAGALFGAGLARAAAWRESGPPHPAQRALLALELGLPPLAIAAARSTRMARSSRMPGRRRHPLGAGGDPGEDPRGIAG